MGAGVGRDVSIAPMVHREVLRRAEDSAPYRVVLAGFERRNFLVGAEVIVRILDRAVIKSSVWAGRTDEDSIVCKINA